MADRKIRIEIIIRKLMENAYKITPRRLAVVDIADQSQERFGVENILVGVKKDFPTMSLATVCGNIVLIRSLGETLELGLPLSHPHVICIEDKKLSTRIWTPLMN